MPATTIYGPMPSKYDSKCLHCQLRIFVNDAIYWAKVRPTKEQYARDIRVPKCTIHASCFNEWPERHNYNVMAYRGQVTSTSSPSHEETQMIQTSVPSTPHVHQSQATGDLLTLIAQGILPLVESKLKATLDTDQIIDVVNTIVEDKLRNQVKRIEVHIVETGEVKDLGIQHKQFPSLVKAAQAKLPDNSRLNIWLAGMAGSGKSKAGEYVARALNLSFGYIGSFNEAHKVFGYVSPIDGKYYSTAFRQAYEHGGVFMFDDFDGSDPVCGVELLGMLANGAAAFPDGMVKRHPDCLVLVSANTWGHGATSDYVGRMKQDAALLNRFIRFDWQLDEDLELATCSNEKWVKRVQQVRGKVASKGLKVLVTPRASYHGAALLEVGFSQSEVEMMVLANGMSKEQWEMVK